MMPDPATVNEVVDAQHQQDSSKRSKMLAEINACLACVSTHGENHSKVPNSGSGTLNGQPVERFMMTFCIAMSARFVPTQARAQARGQEVTIKLTRLT